MERSVRTPVNRGNPEEFAILKVGDLVLELTGRSSPIVLRRLPDDPG